MHGLNEYTLILRADISIHWHLYVRLPPQGMVSITNFCRFYLYSKV